METQYENYTDNFFILLFRIASSDAVTNINSECTINQLKIKLLADRAPYFLVYAKYIMHKIRHAVLLRNGKIILSLLKIIICINVNQIAYKRLYKC